MPAGAVGGVGVRGGASAARQSTPSFRNGGGPVLLEFQTYRFRAHSMFDPELYREKSEVQMWKEKGPVRRLLDSLRKDAAIADAALETMDRKIDERLDKAIAFAEQSAYETPETLERFVMSERSSAP